MDATKFTGLRKDPPPSFKTELLYDDHKPKGPCQQVVAMKCGLSFLRYLPAEEPAVRNTIALVEERLAEIDMSEAFACIVEDSIRWHGNEDGVHGVVYGITDQADLTNVLDYLKGFYGVVSLGVGAWYTERKHALEFVRLRVLTDETTGKPYIVGDTPKSAADVCPNHKNLLGEPV